MKSERGVNMNICVINKRLEKLEAIAPKNLIVTYTRNGEPCRTTVKEYTSACRADGTMYAFKVVDGTKFEDIDFITGLIDDLVKGAM